MSGCESSELEWKCGCEPRLSTVYGAIHAANCSKRGVPIGYDDKQIGIAIKAVDELIKRKQETIEDIMTRRHNIEGAIEVLNEDLARIEKELKTIVETKKWMETLRFK